jgi:signal transduction histidine kinase
MNELALHILDIAQNSLTAGAKHLRITVDEDPVADTLALIIADDGKGMSEALLSSVTSPFATTRTTRKVGLGVPLLKMTAEMTGGSFDIESREGVGTTLTARYVPSSVDMLPLGDMGATVLLLVQQAPEVHLVYQRRRGGQSFTLDTDEIARELDGVPLDNPDVLAFIQGYVEENERELNLS